MPTGRKTAIWNRSWNSLLRGFRSNRVKGLELEVVRLEGRTPLIYMDIPGTGDDVVVLYGHLDKQPEMIGWREGSWRVGTGHRGETSFMAAAGADDGYSTFASLLAIKALQEQDVPHPHCKIIIEGL